MDYCILNKKYAIPQVSTCFPKVSLPLKIPPQSDALK